MDIYSSIGSMAHIVTVPREFHAISTDPEMFTIDSSDVEEALQNAEMDYYGPLVLHTPFHSDEAFCYIATRTRRYRLSDLFKRSDDLYGILPVLLTEKELFMLYSLLYPKKDPDMEAVNNILAGQSAALRKVMGAVNKALVKQSEILETAIQKITQ